MPLLCTAQDVLGGLAGAEVDKLWQKHEINDFDRVGFARASRRRATLVWRDPGRIPACASLGQT